MFESQLSMSEGNRRGNTVGNRGSREVSPSGTQHSTCHRRCERSWRLEPSGSTSINGAGCCTHTSGGVLCGPTSATQLARWSIAVPWRERPRDLAAWPAKPAATEVVAHATLSLPQPERVVVRRVRPRRIEGVRVNSGRRAAIVRLATRVLKALRASSVPLRPRGARLTALTTRVATRSRATIDGQHGRA